MTQKAAPPGGEQVLNIPERHLAPQTAGSETRASREIVTQTSTWINPLREEMGRVIVGQKQLVDRLLIALLSNGHVLLEGVPGPCEDPGPEDFGQLHFGALQAPAVHARHAARRHRRNHDL